jgi:hypothetical protein
MVDVTVRAQGSLAPDAAWERYAVPAVWPDWSPQIGRVECSHARLVEGAHGRVFGPLGIVGVPFAVDSWDDDRRRWSWQVRLGPVRLLLEHGVDARGAGSATFVRVHGPAPLVLGYLPLAKLALRRLVRPSG